MKRALATRRLARPNGDGAPRLGFVGLGWIGRARLDALVAAGAAEAAALCDPDRERLAAAGAAHPGAEAFVDAEELLHTAPALGLDGIVVATPSAAHVAPCVAALENGLAVLCQKPLAVDAESCRRVVAAARAADRLLGVDYTYRGLPTVASELRRSRTGHLGRLAHVHAVFHNAYGPDKAWCWKVSESGGGAFLDLGVHLLDLALCVLGWPKVEQVSASCFREGRRLLPPVHEVEDFAAVRLDVAGGASVDLAASWCAHAGSDCVFRFEAFGADGGLELVNVDGSFFDFELAVRKGRQRLVMARAGRDDLATAAIAWAQRLRRSRRYDPSVAGSIAVAEVVEQVYGRGARSSRPTRDPSRSRGRGGNGAVEQWSSGAMKRVRERAW